VKFLVVGLGSMGKRRIRNLQVLQAGEIVAYDVREDRRAEARQLHGVEVVTSFDAGMGGNPDIVIISTPPHQHLEYAAAALAAGKRFFTEFTWPGTPDRLDVLIDAEQQRFVGAPSCTMRFHPSVQVLKELVRSGRIGKVLCLTYHSGIALPQWHPWEDYHSFYVASKEKGGGREQVMFELDWIRWVFGEIRSVSGYVRKLSTFEIDTYDVYQCGLEFESGAIGSMVVDLIQADINRTAKLMSEEAVALWDWKSRGVRVYLGRERRWEEFPEGGFRGYNVEQMYVDEMHHFLRAVQGEEVYMHSYREEKRLVEVVSAIEQSSATGAKVVLGQVGVVA